MSPSWWLRLSWTEPVTWMSLCCLQALGCCHHLSLKRGGERWSARTGQGPGRGWQGAGAGSGTCPSSWPHRAHFPRGFTVHRGAKNQDLDNIVPPGSGGAWHRDTWQPGPHSAHRAPSRLGCEGAAWAGQCRSAIIHQSPVCTGGGVGPALPHTGHQSQMPHSRASTQRQHPGGPVCWVLGVPVRAIPTRRCHMPGWL